MLKPTYIALQLNTREHYLAHAYCDFGTCITFNLNSDTSLSKLCMTKLLNKNQLASRLSHVRNTIIIHHHSLILHTPLYFIHCTLIMLYLVPLTLQIMYNGWGNALHTHLE